MLYIFDIDGTLADLTHRLHFIQQKPADWDAFYNAARDDAPIYPVIDIAWALGQAGHTIVYSTGRTEDIRKITDDWMDKFRLPVGELFMRTTGDHREDNVVKSELLNKILDIFSAEVMGGVFEDRQQVVDMYRMRSIRVFQVAKGDF